MSSKVNKDVSTQHILRNQNTREEEERFGDCDSEEEGVHRVPIVPGESSYCVAVNKKQNPAASSSATNDQNSSTSAKGQSYHHDKTLIFTTSI